MEDEGIGIAAAGGTIYVTGRTKSMNFPVVGPVQAAFHGIADAFLIKIVE